MLRIASTFCGKKARDGDAGDSNQFLQSVLVEVAAENYRQLMYESIFLTKSGNSGEIRLLDPPLRANERILSGLFSNAIAKTAARSRPEARVDRDEIEETNDNLEGESSDGNTDEPASRPGRVDFLAWYSQRTFAIELKVGSMNCETFQPTGAVEKRWRKVWEQAQLAQNWLRKRSSEDPNRYPDPISISLMVVIARRAASSERVKDLDDEVDDDDWENCSGKRFIDALSGLKPKPIFQALYTFPKEFRPLARRRRGQPVEGSKVMYTPFVAFLARAAVNRNV